MSQQQLFYGYIELVNGEGVVPIDIRRDDEYVNVWISGSIADDAEDLDYFKAVYGSRLYDSLEDYRKGIVIDIDDVWKEEDDSND